MVSGLAAGEVVVTSAQFLVDSESKLREATAKMMDALNKKNTQSSQAESNQTMDHTNHGSMEAEIQEPDHSTMDHSTMEMSEMEMRDDDTEMNHSDPNQGAEENSHMSSEPENEHTEGAHQ